MSRNIYNGRRLTHNMGSQMKRNDLISVRILPNFELIRAMGEMDVWYKFWSDTLKNVE